MKDNCDVQYRAFVIGVWQGIAIIDC